MKTRKVRVLLGFLTALFFVLSITFSAFAEGEVPTQESTPAEEGEVPPEGGESSEGEGEVPPEGGESSEGEGEVPPEGGESSEGEGEVPPEGGESSEGEGEVPPEDGESSEDEEEPQQMMANSSSATGPTDEDPQADLGLPDPGNNGYYGDECEKPGNTCEKNETASEVKDGGTYVAPFVPTVVIIKAGPNEYIFSPNGPGCDLTQGNDPYCVTFNGSNYSVEVNPCYSIAGGSGNCKPAAEISNIQAWETGDDPDDPDDPEDPEDPGDPDVPVIQTAVSTGGTIFSTLSTITGSLGLLTGFSIPFIGKKGKKY